MTHRLGIVLVFLLTFLSPLVAKAADTSANELAAVRQELAEMRAEMSAMRQHYETSIRDLETRLNSSIPKTDAKTASPDEKPAASEKDRLRKAALQNLDASESPPAISESTPTAPTPETTFHAGNQALQALNPEISLTGDVITQFRDQDNIRENARATFRSLGVHGEGYLDPYTRFKTAFPILENGTSLGEAYITRVGFSPHMNLTLGKFHQQFGTINRWHQHGLDQVDFPLALRRLFGGPLNQIGASFDWELAGTGNTARDLTLQVTHANNQALFGQNTRGVPCALVRYKTFRDLDADTYFEWAVTGLAGMNDRWRIGTGATAFDRDESKPLTAVGLEFTRLWEPTDQMRYRHFMWRTEAYHLTRGLLTPAGDEDTVRAWGAYTNFHWKLNRTLESGIRLDYYRPDTKTYAVTPVPQTALYPGALHAVTGANPFEFQISPYWTWHQSPWVRYRLELDFRKGHHMEPDDRRITLQCIWAAGPHLHDRY